MGVTKTWLDGMSLPPPADGWSDRSLLAWAASATGGGVPANVTVSRDERRGPADPAGEAFADYALRQGHLLETSLPGFQARLPTPLDGSTAHACDALFTWRSGAVSLMQWVVWIDAGDGSVLTFAATSESTQFQQNRPVFEAALNSLQFDVRSFPPRD